MRTVVSRQTGAMLALAIALVAMHAGPASADAVTVRGFLDGQLHGAVVLEDLQLVFPDFSLVLPDVTHLMPGFCSECNSGEAIPFGQQTGTFSGHSFAAGTANADVRGSLTFSGPTDTLEISRDPFASAFLSEAVHWSGSLRVTQPNRVLFSGTLSGSGVGSAVYENTGTGDTRLGGYQYIFDGVAVTPEPASLVLLGTGVVWLAARRRKSVLRS